MPRAGINGGGIGGLAAAIAISGAGFGQHGAGATVKLADGSTHAFDLVTGADGIHSRSCCVG